MISSPRSLARRPLLLGTVLFIVGALCAGALFHFAQRSGEARRSLILAQSAKAERKDALRKEAKWNAQGRVVEPLCDPTQPDAKADRERWSMHTDCLRDRQRDPVVQLDAVRAALAAHSPWPAMHLREAKLMLELGFHAESIDSLRRLRESSSGHTFDQATVELARAVLFFGEQPWEHRRFEAQSLLSEKPRDECSARGLLVLAAWPDEQELRSAAERYVPCADRTSDGEIETLMEIIGAGVAVSNVQGAPVSVYIGPHIVANNFDIKSVFAMCAEAVPDPPDLREQCRAVLSGPVE